MKTARTETIAMQQHLVEKTLSPWHSHSPEHSTAHTSPMISPQDLHSQEHSVQLKDKIEQQSDSDKSEESDSAVARLGIGVDGINRIRSNSASKPCLSMSSGPIDASRNVPEPLNSTSSTPSPPPSHSETHPADASAGATAITRDSDMCSPLATHVDRKEPSLKSDSGNTIGLNQWHTWSKQNYKTHGGEPAEITVPSLLQYLESVLIPLESELGASRSSSSRLPPQHAHQSTASMLETYIKPVLQLWQEQLQRSQQRTHLTLNDHLCHNAHDQATPFSSVTDMLALKPAADMGRELPSPLLTRSLRQQDHVERLSELEQAHRDTAVTISLLQDQVRHLLKERDIDRAHDRGQDHHNTVRNGGLAPMEWHRRQDNADVAHKLVQNGAGRGSFDKQGPNGSLEKTTMLNQLDGEQMELEKDGVSTAPPDRLTAHSPAQQARASQGDYGCFRRSCADELVEAIAKGLEEYHGRSSQVQRALFSQHTRPLAQDDHRINGPHPDQYPLRPKATAVIYGPQLDREKFLDRVITGEAGLPQRDLLQPGQNDRPMRNRKRTSSMNGLGSLVKDNVKQARSCSPPRPRNSSGVSLVDSVTGGRDHGGTDFTSHDRRHVHAQSQPPPSSNFTSPLQADYYDKPGARDAPESAASSTESSSAVFHQGSGMDPRMQVSHYSTPPFPHQNGHQDYRPSYGMHSHTHSHASQTPRPTMYSEEDYPVYHQHHHLPQSRHVRKHSYDQAAPYRQQQHADGHGELKEVSAPMSREPGEHYVSPYFPSATSSTTIASDSYRGKHTKNYGSFSSVQSFSQHQPHHALHHPHQYQRSDSHIVQGYDHHHQHPSLETDHFQDPQDEDVKPMHHQLHLHQSGHHHHDQHQHPHSQHHHHQRQPSSCSAPPPIYVMNRQVNTVPELWKEWTVGLGPGNPSIRQLEAQYGPSWRTSSSAANFFSRRLRIINEIQRMIDFEGLSEEEAVNRLEARREQGVVIPGTEASDASSSNGAGGGPGQPVTGGMSLHRLSEILRKKQL